MKTVKIIVAANTKNISQKDVNIEGVYRIHFEEDVLDNKAATAALDAFHNQIPIEVLDDFDFIPMTMDNVQLSKDLEVDSYKSRPRAFIEKTNESVERYLSI